MLTDTCPYQRPPTKGLQTNRVTLQNLYLVSTHFCLFLNPDLGLKSTNLTEVKSLEAYEKPLVNTLDKIEEELKVAASTVDAVKLVDLINAEKKGCQDVVNDLKDAKRRVSAEKRSQGINKPRKAAVAEEVPVESDSEGSQSA